jgi:hypothetical protein
LFEGKRRTRSRRTNKASRLVHKKPHGARPWGEVRWAHYFFATRASTHLPSLRYMNAPQALYDATFFFDFLPAV